ncbi:Sec23/Sec24 zinc finger family protein [Trichomonas vaginalis G3]|uniref:Sec23/Sec24 zinc finger family protein n=1 Tax=Trichomonas vaginalis (strain ATCC PRA-98 / G3) TaxID=412133 RepID=A2D8P3_TRIV3|nr:ER to Golgi vesicle-mediated transport [Trichomonas vaginalis G3]EAY23292.1 Sec23/Sec24 zinc finger family protein [Trichomonas vaginalis G3]KAI5534060.1 ER to Golgi vesicle-mediated transport [Trichomonas vaginalis G3]|eukprot:XP_001584278.1 Sec23/Sec24 zinc finger family protein [Trichomonas vaginalis G3]
MNFWRTVLGPSKVPSTGVQKETKIEYPKVNVDKYITSTIKYLPVYKKDKDIIKVPFTIAVTPVISEPEKIPKMEYRYDEAPRCHNCGTICNPKSILFEGDQKFLCNICKSNNDLGPNMKEKVKSNQFHVNMVEYPFKDTTLANSPLRNVFIIEKSESTIKTGLFRKTLDKLTKHVKTLKSGYFSLFILTNTLTIPQINENRQEFSNLIFEDFIDLKLPSIDSVFFDISKEKDLLIQYINSTDDLQPNQTQSNIFEIIDSISPSYAGKNVMFTMVTSTVTIGKMSEAKELGHKLLSLLSHFDLFVMAQKDVDYSPLSELSMLNNSHLTIFGEDQIEFLSDDILYRIFCQKCPAALITCKHPSFVSIKEIKGCGISRNENSFITTVCQPNDTFFFFFEYTTDHIEFTSPSMIFETRLTHEDGSTTLTVYSLSFSVVNNHMSVMQNANVDLILQSYIMHAIDDGRNKGDEQMMLQTLDKLKEEYLDETFVQLMLTATGDNMMKYARICFGTAAKILNYETACEVYTKTPQEFGYFFVPKYLFLTDETKEVPPLKYLNGFNKFDHGALFVKRDSRHSVILLAQNEEIKEWIENLNELPLKVIMRKILTTPSLEMIHPRENQTNRTFILLSKCITAPLPEIKKD